MHCANMHDVRRSFRLAMTSVVSILILTAEFLKTKPVSSEKIVKSLPNEHSNAELVALSNTSFLVLHYLAASGELYIISI